MRPEQLELVVRVGTPAVHPSGGHAVVATSRPSFTTDGYVGQLWRVPLDGQGEPRRLTRGRTDASPRFSPDGSLLGFLRGDGEGRPQLWLMPTDGGEAMQVTDQKLGVGEFRFSPDSRMIVFGARVPGEGRYGTLDGVSPAQEDPRHFDTLKLQANGLGWNRDRRRHLFRIEVPDVFAEPWLEPVGRAKPSSAGLADGAAKDVGNKGLPVAVQLTEGDADDSGIAFSADGLHVHFTSARHDGADLDLVDDLCRVPLAGGEVEPLTEGLGVEGCCVSGDNVFLQAAELGPDGLDFVGTNTSVWLLDGEPRRLVDPEDFALAGALAEDGRGGVLAPIGSRGRVHLARIDAEGTLEILLDGDVVVQSAVAIPGTDEVLAVVSDARTPGELCRVADKQATPLTGFGRPLAEQTQVVEPRELVASAADGHPVHGWVLTPEGAGPHPVLLLIHGGPFAAYHVDWFDEFQAYVGAGYAVVACNPRGSSGYGQAHGRAIKGDLGRLDMADVLAFLDHAVATQPQLDGERVGIMGGSYGGYLTAWIIGHDSRWAGAIVERGFLDPRSFIGSSDIGWFFTGEYNTREPERMDAQSPMHLTDRVSTPTLVLHSENDLRCPLSQALRYYTQLKLAGVESELLVFPGENHELSRSGTPWHRRQRLEAILGWWARHLPVA